MPVFDYQCRNCSTTYDVYHKGKELAEDVVCPSCASNDSKKLMSVPAASVADRDPAPSRSSGGCCGGGACGLN